MIRAMTWIRLAFVVVSCALVTASYLTIATLGGSVPPCSIGSCETVLTSEYSAVGGMSLASIGVIFDLVFLVALAVLLLRPSLLWWRAAALLAFGGAVASFGLFSIQALILQAYCIYCSVHALLLLVAAGCLFFGFRYQQVKQATLEE